MKQNELLSAFIEQSRLISDIARQFVGTQTQPNPLIPVVDKLQAVIEAQQATLDRIVTAKYDKPIERVVHPVQSEQLPMFAMNDQGDVRPDDPIKTGIENLHVESDAAFLASVQ